MMDDDDVARFWDANAPTWANDVRKGYDTYRHLFNNPAFFEFCGSLAGLDVLDVGCGEGYNTRLHARRGARVTGVDISAEMIRLAREQEEAEPLGIRFALASGSDLSLFEDERFDAAVSTMAMMDMADYEGALREIARVLKRGGAFVFSICHPCFSFGGLRVEGDADGRLSLRLSVDYFSNEPTVERWRFGQAPAGEPGGPFQVPRFLRTLSGYLNPLAAAGLRVVEVGEPRPTEDAARQDPRLDKWRYVPAFLYVRAVKAP